MHLSVDPLQYSTVQYSTVQYSTVQYSTDIALKDPVTQQYDWATVTMFQYCLLTPIYTLYDPYIILVYTLS